MHCRWFRWGAKIAVLPNPRPEKIARGSEKSSAQPDHSTIESTLMAHISITTELMRLTHDDDLLKETLKPEMDVPVIGTGGKFFSNSVWDSSMIEFYYVRSGSKEVRCVVRILDDMKQRSWEDLDHWIQPIWDDCNTRLGVEHGIKQSGT